MKKLDKKNKKYIKINIYMITSKYKVGVHMIDFLVIKSGEIFILSALSVFPIAGFVVFFSNLKKYLRIKKNCKVLVYRYLYNGNEYITTSTTYSLEND